MSDLHDHDGNAPTSDDVAADYVMGLLEPAAAAEAERRIAVDTAFAQAVENWRARLNDFDTTAGPIAPSGTLWSRIDANLGAPTHSEPRPAMLARLWNSLDALRLTTASATAAAILCAGLAVFFYQAARNTAATKPVYVAILVSDTTRLAGAVVNTFADGHAELVPLVAIDVPAGRALQIWTLWDRAVGPKAVGLIERARSTRLDIERLPQTAVDQLFEITLEPEAGSPIGRPTGPILFKGTTSRAL